MFWIASHSLVRPPDDRRIYLYIPPQHFTEENLKRVFTDFAAKYIDPHSLWIYAYSDKEALKKGRAYKEAGVCVQFLDTPEGRRAERNWYLTSEPARNGHLWADYYRLDERESFTYNPDPEKGTAITVDLSEPVPKYGGEPTANLVTAIDYDDVERVRSSIKAGANLNHNSKYYATPLMMAVLRGQYEIVKELLKAGAKVNYRLNSGITEGETALMSAADIGDAEMIRLLLDAGADINAHNDDSKYSNADTPLIMAAIRGYSKAVQTLIVKGAKVDDRNRFGETALMVAAIARFPKVIQVLLDSGADVNTRDKDGSTALMLAGDDRETVETLIRSGADFKTKNNHGITAMLVALGSFQSEKAQALVDSGAGKESLEAWKERLASIPRDGDRQNDYLREDGYRILSELYVKLGEKEEAIKTCLQAIKEFGDKAHLRARLGFTYIKVGNKEAAWEQYRILQKMADSGGWDKALLEELKK